jgi:hypothetical protein
MKKNVIYLIILALLAFAVIYLFKFKGDRSSIASQLKDFAIADTAAISRVVITDKQGKILVLKKEKSGWFVNDTIPARKDIVQVLLETLKRIEVKSPVNKPMRENVMKQLSTGAIKVQVYNNDDLQKSFFVGGPTMDGTGTFMILADADEPLITHIPGFDGYLTVRFNTNAEIWRDREIFRYHPSFIDAIEVQYPTSPAESFVLKVANKDQVSIANGKGEMVKGNVNADFLRSYLDSYMNIQYENIIQLAPSTRDSVLVPQNLLATITVVNKEGAQKSIQIYKRYWNGRAFVDKGTEVEFDQDRVFVVINQKVVANGQYRTFNKLIVRYQDFTNPPIQPKN